MILIGKNGREIRISGETGRRKRDIKRETQLHALIKEIAGQAEKEHIPKVRILWQPVLPARLAPEDLEGRCKTEGEIRYPDSDNGIV